ncbi:MAG: ribokinase [Pseudomonadota bacterium]
MAGKIVVMGVFNADTTYRAERLPRMGETIHGTAFVLGPGGKGSNQAVAAAKAGGDVHFITRLGNDAFGEMAKDIWRGAGVTAEATVMPGQNTGAALIFVEDSSGDNCIVIAPGAAAEMDAVDTENRRDLVNSAAVFLTQLEQPLEAAAHGLAMAKKAGAVTILNPAPAEELPDSLYAHCDYITPNETEAETLTGVAVTDRGSAEAAGRVLLERGVGAAVLTLGENGSLLVTTDGSRHAPIFHAGAVVETTGAGDAFNGGFAVALAEGLSAVDAMRFGSAVAGLSVTKAGAAPSMPTRAEIDTLLKGG